MKMIDLLPGMRRCAVAAMLVAGLATGARAEDGITDDTITLGAFLPLTGPIADVGAGALHGALAYINAVNERGGINGRKINWTTVDDGYQPPRALAGARRLLESDKVLGIFGTTGTGTALAVLPYLKKQQALFLFPYAAARQFTQPAIPGVYTVLPTYEEQTSTLVEYLIKERHAQRIAFVYMNESENSAAAASAVKLLEKLGMKAAASVSFEKNTANFSSVVLQLQQANPDYVIEIATTPDFARIIQEATARDFHPQWCGTSTATDSIVIKLLGKDAEGILGISPIKAAADTSDPAVAEYQRDLKKYYPDDNPSAYNIFAYAGAKIMVGALQKAGRDLTRASLLKALEEMKDFDTGLTAPVSFSPTEHMGLRQAIMLQVRGGKFVTASDWMTIEARD